MLVLRVRLGAGVPRVQVERGGDLPPHRDAAARVIQEWRALGITHVVDNRFEWNDPDLVADHCLEIHYLHHGVDDAGQQMPDAVAAGSTTRSAFTPGARRTGSTWCGSSARSAPPRPPDRRTVTCPTINPNNKE